MIATSTAIAIESFSTNFSILSYSIFFIIIVICTVWLIKQF